MTCEEDTIWHTRFARIQIDNEKRLQEKSLQIAREQNPVLKKKIEQDKSFKATLLQLKREKNDLFLRQTKADF